MKILLADDSSTMRRIQVNMLNGLGYNEILEADCGEDVLSVLAANPDVSIVLLDWNMPLMNGLDCLKAIRTNPDTRAIPVVMVTSEAMKSRIVEAIQGGVNKYLLKPFDAVKLRDAIESLIGKKEVEPA